MGRHSVIFSLICPAFTINLGVSYLSVIYFVTVFTWHICTGIASDFVSAYFSASMRADMPCFPGTTLSRIIAISCRRLASCSTLCRLNPNALYTTCIIIDLQQPSQECFPTIHTPKAMLKNSSCGPDT